MPKPSSKTLIERQNAYQAADKNLTAANATFFSEVDIAIEELEFQILEGQLIGKSQAGEVIKLEEKIKDYFKYGKYGNEHPIIKYYYEKVEKVSRLNGLIPNKQERDVTAKRAKESNSNLNERKNNLELKIRGHLESIKTDIDELQKEIDKYPALRYPDFNKQLQVYLTKYKEKPKKIFEIQKEMSEYLNGVNGYGRYDDGKLESLEKSFASASKENDDFHIEKDIWIRENRPKQDTNPIADASSEVAKASEKRNTIDPKQDSIYAERKARLVKQGVSPETIDRIVKKTNLPADSIKGDDSKIKKDIDSSFLNGIFEVYSEENQKQYKNEKTLNELNSLLTDEFSRQQTSFLKGIILEQKDNNVTHFSTKAPLTVANSTSNDKTSELGRMEGKTSATLYADKLGAAKPEDKASFYEAIFLQGMYGESFERNVDGTLKLMQGTLSIASLPQNQVLKDETLEHLALFKKKYPNIDVRMDSLPQADKDKFEKLVNAQPVNPVNTMKFHSEVNIANEAAKATTESPKISVAPQAATTKLPKASVAIQATAPVVTFESELEAALAKRRAATTNPPESPQSSVAKRVVNSPSLLARTVGVGGPASIFGGEKTNSFDLESKKNMQSKAAPVTRAKILEHAKKHREAENAKKAKSQTPNSISTVFLTSSMTSQNSNTSNDPTKD